MTAHGERRWRAGVAALAKCALLLGGVPLALARLWSLAPGPFEWRLTDPGTRLHLLLALIAAVWLIAGGALVLNLWRAFRGKTARPTSWSWRWAAALAALVLSAAASSTQVRSPASSSPAASAGAVVGVTAMAPLAPTTPAASEAGQDHAAFLVGLLGLGTLGTAALARRLRLLRRVGECLRRPGERSDESDRQAALVEALVGPLADLDLLDWIEATNRLLWRAEREAARGTTRPDVTMLRAGSDGVELLLSSPVSPPLDGFVALDGGRRWLLDPTLDLDTLEALTANCGRLMPALIPVGDDGDASYLVPVGPGRRLVVAGDGEEVAAVFAALLVALRTLPWCEELTVELIGAPAPDRDEGCHQLSASSFAELDALAAAASDPGAARTSEHTDRLTATFLPSPLIVACRPVNATEESVLARLASHAGIVSSGGEGSHRLIVDEHGALFEPLGLALYPPRPRPSQQALVERLLRAAAAPPIAPPAGGADEDGGAAIVATTVDPWPGARDVRILCGTPRICGADEVAPSDEARVVEVVAYMLVHGHGASLDELCNAVFARAGRPGSARRAQHVCSAARRALGVTAAGTSFLAAAVAGRYELDRQVTGDWLRVADLAAEATRRSPDDAARLLERALGLVETVPSFLSTSGWTWFHAEGHARRLTATVVDAAHHLATLALAAGEASRARWAIERGRRFEPASETLVRDLLAACELDGDCEGITAAYEALEAELDRLGGNEPSPATRALYDELLRALVANGAT